MPLWAEMRQASALLQQCRNAAEHEASTLVSVLDDQGLRQLTTLAYESVCSKPGCKAAEGAAKPTALVVHGLLGSGRNWRTFARNLANETAYSSGRPWRMLMVDQRNHGASSTLPFHPPHSIEASAEDLADLIGTKLGGRVPEAILGHSLGGKTVLQFLKQAAASGSDLPKQVWVLDAPVGPTNGKDGQPSDTDRVINEILDIPLPVPSRRWLYDYMSDRGYSPAIQQWLGSNLVPYNGSGFKWAFNISGAAAMFGSFKRLGYWDLLQSPPEGVDIHIVRAANSDRFSRRELEQLEGVGKGNASRDGRVHVHVLPDAGHWLHVENPEGLLKIISPSLAAAARSRPGQ